MSVPFDDSRRVARLFGKLKVEDRSQSEKDCDRILYSSAFKRLSGVTQVVRAGDADIFHTRQQHTLKVAQIGRRIAQRLSRVHGEAYAHLGIDENVVEAACLAHDLGHPPFGHIGEEALDEFSRKHNDGFEGNAQSFRIVCKLAVRDRKQPGLNLTQATLSALLKYPWLRDRDNPDRSTKWNAYHCDEQYFRFATSVYGEIKTVEAEIMDWADDITYSVHDVEDLHRTNLVPWRSLLEGDLSDRLIDGAVKRWHNAPVNARDRLKRAQGALSELLLGSPEKLLDNSYEASREQRSELRHITSRLIGEFVCSFNLSQKYSEIFGRPKFVVDENHQDQIKVLKQINWLCIVNNPSLVAQQAGQKQIVRSLCIKIANSCKGSYPRFLPTRLRYLWDLSDGDKIRFTTDCVSSLTEQEAFSLNARLCGYDSGSVLDPIVR